MNNNNELLLLLVEMTKATRCCQQDAVFCNGVTFTQFYILELINQQGILPLSEMHNILSVEKSTSTRLIEPLVKRELVIKERSNYDTRAINLKLTLQGQSIHQELWNCFNDFLNKLVDEFPVDRRDEIIQSVMIFLKAVKKVFKNNSCCID